MFSTDNILVVKDTRREEYYKEVCRGWEEKEVGRSERAKLSRRRYLIMKKHERG